MPASTKRSLQVTGKESIENMPSPNPTESAKTNQTVRTAGVDGCRGGWLVVDCTWHNQTPQNWSMRLITHFDQLFAPADPPQMAAVDIPIGLADHPIKGGRECDRLARKLLGRPRSSSVFSPPSRQILHAESFDQVRGKGMTIQGFHIMPKIRETDAWITPQRQKTVFEAHPELAFYRLAGLPIAAPKRSPKGKQQRLQALAKIFLDIETRIADQKPAEYAAHWDDLIDALVLSWVAFNKLHGKAAPLPDPPPKDSKGLDMVIWS